MITRYQKSYSSWIDMNLPDREEVIAIMDEFKIDATIGNDLLHPTPQPRVSASGDKLYTVVHIPVFKHSHAAATNKQEIDFVIGRKMLITVRYDTIDALFKYAKEVEVRSMLDREEGGNHTFVEIMAEIYKSLFDELAFMEDNLREIERKIFLGHEKEMVLHISKVGRDLLNFRRIIEPHGEMFAEMKSFGVDILGKKFNTEIDSLVEKWQRLMQSAENHANFLAELRETNNSLLSTKQNETMKVLAIISFVMFPLTLVAALFSLNTDYIPLVGREGDFWYVVGIMLVMTSFMFVYFKYKKWL